MKVVMIAIALAAIMLGCKQPETTSAPEEHASKPTALEILSQLVAQGEELKAVPFPSVVRGTTGHEVIPIKNDDAIAAEIVSVIVSTIRDSIEQLNREDSPVREKRRINEASQFFEAELLTRINATDSFTCELPPTAQGNAQRSGYPDLKITHQPSGRVAYLDPKLFETGSRESTLRTFYFEPKTETNKILDDAHHLLIGIEHDGNEGHWQFTNWHLVDLHELTVRLKPEFQASNREVYGEKSVISSGH